MDKVNLSAVNIILPFERNALEPYLSEESISLHLLHHQAYINNYKKLETEYPDLANKEDIEALLTDLSYELEGEGVDFGPAKVFQNAGQIWNHNFFWQSMAKDKKPSEKIIKIIENSYGSMEKFREDFINEGMSGFGSYWLWIVAIGSDCIDLLVTDNADSPNFSTSEYYTSKFSAKKEELTPLIACDVWEHSFYVTYKNQKKTYLENFFDHLINWEFLENRLMQINSAVEE